MNEKFCCCSIFHISCYNAFDVFVFHSTSSVSRQQLIFGLKDPNGGQTNRIHVRRLSIINGLFLWLDIQSDCCIMTSKIQRPMPKFVSCCFGSISVFGHTNQQPKQKKPTEFSNKRIKWLNVLMRCCFVFGLMPYKEHYLFLINQLNSLYSFLIGQSQA